MLLVASGKERNKMNKRLIDDLEQQIKAFK